MSIEAAQAYICSHQNIAAANVDAVVDVVCSTRAGSQQNCSEQGGAGDLGFTSSELRQTLLQVRGNQTDGAALQNNVRRFCETTRPNPNRQEIPVWGQAILAIGAAALFIAAPFIVMWAATGNLLIVKPSHGEVPSA